MNKKEKGFIDQNGIKINGDILLHSSRHHTMKLYFPLQILISFVITFVTTIIAESFVDTGSSVIKLFAFCFMSVISLGIIKCKNKVLRWVGIVSSLIIVIYQILNISKVKDGLLYFVYKYVTKAKLAENSNYISDISSIKYDNAVSSFYFALIVLIAFGVCVSCIYRTDFALLFLFTFPIVELGLYWGWDVSVPALILLVVGWILILSVQLINHNTNKAGKKNTFAIHEKKKTFYLTAENEKRSFFTVFTIFVCAITLCAFLCVMAFSWFTGFSRPGSFDKYRREISLSVKNFTLKNIGTTISNYDGGLNLFTPKAVGGINGGVLGTDSEIKFNNSTALKITTDKFSSTMYLKGYVAGKYEKNCWTPVNAENEQFVQMLKKDGLIAQNISCKALSRNELKQKTIDITVKNASKKYVYAPYYSNYQSIDNSNGKDVIPTEEGYVTSVSKSYTIPFYDYDVINNYDGLDLFINGSKSVEAYDKFVHDNYMSYNESKALIDAYNEIYNNYLSLQNYDDQLEDDEGNFSYNYRYSYTDVYNAVKQYFEDNFSYTLSPGKTPEGKDFIDYFLTEQKKGYCSYFASAGVELLRMFGYPARYVEGYVVLPSQYEKYSDNKFEYTVKDKSAHAWAEVYFDGFGWMPAEFTPGYTDDNPNLTNAEKYPSKKNNTDSSKNESSSKTETSQTTTTSQKSTTASANKKSDISSSETLISENSSQSDVLATQKKSNGIGPFCIVILICISLVLLFLVIILRRKYLLDVMKKDCAQSDKRKQVKAIFNYTIKYFSLVGIQVNVNRTDSEICKKILRECKKRNIDIESDKIRELYNIAIKADMSKNDISDEEIAMLKNVMKNVSEEIKKHLSFISKVKAKFIICLY